MSRIFLRVRGAWGEGSVIDRLSAAAKLGAGRKIKRLQREWAEDGITGAQQLRPHEDDEEL